MSINWLIALVASLLVAVAIWGIFIERALYVVRKESVRVLPLGSNPITVLQVGDIHMAPWQKSKQKFIQSLAKYPIDLVVNLSLIHI